ncbi:hypothetical protein [Xanthomonas sp. D-109]|uniref:hypothetical protein n=1 Tax=Xanthomonas sp. D-109 TaxID=2821274 RepID=UPI001ADD1FE2|nr:hypothetical protein [Xanthomonas sp. D-109]MBO9880710.1 hypothetical protein [Xanthomonas sp. D-109]
MSELETQIREKADLAVEQFQDRAGGRLDYSIDSLLVVEEMLDEASEYVGQMPPTDIVALVQLLGSYFLNVAHTAHGGEFVWHQERDQPVLVVGEPNFHVALMAFTRVRGRLNGNKADNILFFYQGFDERVRSALPGTRVLYV